MQQQLGNTKIHNQRSVETVDIIFNAQVISKHNHTFELIMTMEFNYPEDLRQFKGVPEQPTLVSIPLFCSWHKKCHIHMSELLSLLWDG
jgi:hypothetical protein